MKAIEALKNVFVGSIMGIFLAMPGASGATMAVVFGIYERLIRDVSHLTKYLIKDLLFLLTIGVGGVIGVLICAKGLDFLIDNYTAPLMFFFAFLIAVQIPDIKKQGDDGERMTSVNYLALIVGFVIMLAFLAMGGIMEQAEEGGAIVMFLAGIVYALCALLPGISGSTILLAMGLLGVVLDSLSNIHIIDILPLAAGAVVSVILFSKLINKCLTDHRRSTYCFILGLTAGSVVTVLVEALQYDLSDCMVHCVVASVLGLILGYVIHLFSSRFAPTEDVQESD